MKKYTNEKDVKAELKRMLNIHNWFWWMPSANGYGTSGVADFCAIRNGVFMALETKFKNNQPTVMQKSYLVSIVAEDGLSFVVNEDRLIWLASWLEAFDRAVAAESRGEKPAEMDGALLIDAVKEMTTDQGIV